MYHSGVFPVIHLVINNRVGVISHVGISRNAVPDGFALCKRRRFLLTVGAGDPGDSLRQLLGQVCTLQGLTGRFLVRSIHRIIPNHFAKNHIRVIGKIAVDGYAVLRLGQMYPVRFYINGTVAFLQEDNIRSDLCTGICLKCRVWQADCPQQFSPLGNVFPDLRRLLIHGALGGNERHDSAGPYLIQSLGKEVIVNQEIVAVELTIRNLVRAKGHVAYGQVKKVFPIRLFKARHFNVGLRVEVLRDPAGDAVQLHTVQTAALHAFRQKSEEIADTARRLQDIAALKAHLLHGSIDCPDHDG